MPENAIFYRGKFNEKLIGEATLDGYVLKTGSGTTRPNEITTIEDNAILIESTGSSSSYLNKAIGIKNAIDLSEYSAISVTYKTVNPSASYRKCSYFSIYIGSSKSFTDNQNMPVSQGNITDTEYITKQYALSSSYAKDNMYMMLSQATAYGYSPLYISEIMLIK